MSTLDIVYECVLMLPLILMYCDPEGCHLFQGTLAVQLLLDHRQLRTSTASSSNATGAHVRVRPERVTLD